MVGDGGGVVMSNVSSISANRRDSTSSLFYKMDGPGYNKGAVKHTEYFNDSCLVF